MAKKHQIHSSNKKTRQKATRKWRRQAKERDVALVEKIHPGARSVRKPKEVAPPKPPRKFKKIQPAVNMADESETQAESTFGTNLGELLKAARGEGASE